jgi:ligand-binding SRPBCC domain-containing protein
VFEASQVIPRQVEEVFAFFRTLANLVQMSPPQLHLRLVEGPALIELGARIVLQGRRWGLPQRMVSEITAFEAGVSFTDTQIEGPFRRWVHRHSFEAVPEGTRVRDHIEYEPPGGLLGLIVRAGMIESDLKWLFDYRQKKAAALLSG